jgi:hypothetical protein
LASLVAAFWIVGTSESFQDCFKQTKNTNHYEALHQSPSVIVRSIVRLDLNRVCVGEFANKDEGALSVLAAFIVALFTFALWRSTDKLWEASDQQRREARTALKLEIAATKASLVISRQAAEAAKKSADAAVASQRAWVRVDLDIASDLSDDGNGARLEFITHLQNVGNTPATEVEIWIAMTCGGRGFIPPQVADDKIPAPIPGSLIAMGITLFPNEIAQPKKFGRITEEEIQTALDGAMATGHLYVGVLVAVDYKFPGGEGKTRRRYALWGPGIMESIDIRKLPIQPNRLRLQETPLENKAT